MISKEVKKIITNALAEDIGKGDLTTKAIVRRDQKGRAAAWAKDDFVVAGLDIFLEVFKTLDKKIMFRKKLSDGSVAHPGEIIVEISGSLTSILQAERVALNIFQRMCGIATLASRYVRAVRGTKAKILDTRKTAPGLRILDKMAVRLGGAQNHRFGLDDGVLIKDNHIAAAGGIPRAVELMRKKSPLGMKIEVETRNFQEVKEALQCGVDIILLDNMTVTDMKKVVDIARGRALLEASGNVNLSNVARIARAGVDFISVGELTHSVRAADISLKIESHS